VSFSKKGKRDKKEVKGRGEFFHPQKEEHTLHIRDNDREKRGATKGMHDEKPVGKPVSPKEERGLLGKEFHPRKNVILKKKNPSRRDHHLHVGRRAGKSFYGPNGDRQSEGPKRAKRAIEFQQEGGGGGKKKKNEGCLIQVQILQGKKLSGHNSKIR